MDTDRSDGFAEERDTVNETRAALLRVIDRADGDVPTTRLREETHVPQGSIHYHMDTLIDAGLVESAGKDEDVGPIPVNLYRLSDRGEEFLQRGSVREFASSEEVAQLEQRVDELEEQQDKMRTAFNHLREKVKEVHPDFN